MIGILLFFFASPVQAETADSIMARVAENQNRAEKARSAFVYNQSELLRLKFLNGKLDREESSEYTVTPTEKGIIRTRTQFHGTHINHGKPVEYSRPSQGGAHVIVDFDENETKDGIDKDLFPLTAKEQAHYNFQLDGTEDYRGTPVYRIFFEPKKGATEACFAGEALIHRTEYQPVLVTTRLSTKIPIVVRTVLGTNLEHLGFKLNYRKFDEGLWLPVSYSGEMKLRVLFFVARKIGYSVQNSGFRKAEVTSKVNYTDEK